MTAPDYSAYLTPERLQVEEQLWAEVGMYRIYADEVIRVADAERCDSIIEVGCGTGWVPTCLPRWLFYTGLDANEECVRLALAKNTTGVYIHRDVRNTDDLFTADMVCSFAVLKHFALHEWDEIVGKMLRLGRVGVFTMNVGTEDMDDFTEGFPHTWVTMQRLNQAVHDAGHQVIETRLLHTGETMVRTCTR